MPEVICLLGPEAVRKLRQTCRAARDASPEIGENYWREAVRVRFPGLVALAAEAASYEIFYKAAVWANVSSDATASVVDSECNKPRPSWQCRSNGLAPQTLAGVPRPPVPTPS
jgi:hypothetical protein